MIRWFLAPRAQQRDAIRWRGDQPNRLESFSDAVFGFAITLLVLSLEVPRTYDALIELMRGVPAFAFSFGVVATIWWRQSRFFRRYGLEDATTVRLNILLLFLVVIYVYPLKFLFDLAFAMTFDHDRGMHMLSSWDDARGLLAIYGVGFAAVFVVLGALSLHAYRLRDELALTVDEARHTLGDVLDFAIGALAALAMVGLGFVLRDDLVFTAQLVLLVIPLVRRGRRWLSNRRAARLTP